MERYKLLNKLISLGYVNFIVIKVKENKVIEYVIIKVTNSVKVTGIRALNNNLIRYLQKADIVSRLGFITANKKILRNIIRLQLT